MYALFKVRVLDFVDFQRGWKLEISYLGTLAVNCYHVFLTNIHLLKGNKFEVFQYIVISRWSQRVGKTCSHPNINSRMKWYISKTSWWHWVFWRFIAQAKALGREISNQHLHTAANIERTRTVNQKRISPSSAFGVFTSAKMLPNGLYIWNNYEYTVWSFVFRLRFADTFFLS